MAYLYASYMKTFFHHLYHLIKLFGRRIDKHTATLIVGWMRKKLEGRENPRQRGKGFLLNRSGQ